MMQRQILLGTDPSNQRGPWADVAIGGERTCSYALTQSS